MDMDFAIGCPLVLPQLPRYPVAVRRVASSLHTSFRRFLAVPPLCFTRASPPSGCTGDFHPQTAGHAQHTARDAPLTRWPTAMLDRRSQPYARQHRSGRRDGLFRSNKGMERSRIVDSPRVFHAHRLSGVGGRAPPNLVPLFAAHHMECSQLDWRSAIPLVSVEINIFLCTLDDENLSRNITYRDQFSRVSTSNTVLWLIGPLRSFGAAV